MTEFVRCFGLPVIWILIVGLSWATAIACVWIGFKMGRMTKGEQGNLFLGVTKKVKPYEDEPGGVFEDHVAGGKYDQIEIAEQTERMKTI